MLRKSFTKIGHASRRGLLACGISVGLLFSLVLPAAATDAFPTTDDHSTEIAAPRWWYYGVTGAQVTTFAKQDHARLTQVRVDNPATPTFDVTMVADSGAYLSAWWWRFGLTSDQVNAFLTRNRARLISIDPYRTRAGLRFAVVMVPDTGAQARSWWWYSGVTGEQVATLLSQHTARLTELRPYLSNGQVVFAVVMISNTGADNTDWEWWTGASPAFIKSHIRSDDMRVIALTRDPGGGFDVIMVASEGETWSWRYAINAATLEKNIVAHGTRLIDLDSYTVSGRLVFTAVELGDNNPPQAPINAESTRVNNYASANGWAAGYHGEYFISSRPGSAPIVAVNSSFRFEPASSIKVLYLLYTLKKGVSLSSPITYYWPGSGPPDPEACPAYVPQTPANAHVTTIGTALNGMIRQSNNIFARAFAIHWGLRPVEAMARSLGMTGTHLDQPYIGCGFSGVPGGVRNELTLSDAAKLYAAVSNGTALSGKARNTFFTILVGGIQNASTPWGLVVKQEAAKLKKSSIVSKFLAKLNVRWKPGAYMFCLADSCAPYNKLDLALIGWISIPFMAKGKVSAHTYEFGDFVNDLPEFCSSCTRQTDALNNLENVGAEAARTAIRQALATWP